MSLNIKKADGSLQKIAGNTVILDATTSEIRSGTFSLSGTSWSTQNITFTTPMPDTNYVVNIESNGLSGGAITPFRIANKTINGFTLGIYSNEAITYTGTYYAIRLVELEGYTEIQNKINNPDTEPTENSTNLVESGGVYEMIKNASSVFIGTAAEWAIETDKESYQLAVITDTDTINTVNSTTGATDPVADYTGAWTGTATEWDALSISEKVKYKIVNITDDEASSAEAYSTEETYTGKVWIDGKPIYRRVFNVNNINTTQTAAWVTILQDAWIETIDTIISSVIIGEFGNTSSGKQRIISFDTGINNNILKVYTGYTVSIKNNTCVLEYTKTTD